MPELLRDCGVHTHLVTDHYHYFEDGGATYHIRYRSYEAFRVQEGDAWKGVVGDQNDMWKDTMLIVCTDHGFMLGEHDPGPNATFRSIMKLPIRPCLSGISA